MKKKYLRNLLVGVLVTAQIFLQLPVTSVTAFADDGSAEEVTQEASDEAKDSVSEEPASDVEADAVVTDEGSADEPEQEEPAAEESEDDEAVDEELVDEEEPEEVTEEEPEEPIEDEEPEIEDSDDVTYLLKVIDQYLDEEGTEEQSDIRYEENVPEGEEYSFGALDVEGYDLISDEELSGIVTEDTTLIFTYSKIAESDEVAEIQLYAEEPAIMINVYTSEEAFDNGEAPYIVLNSTDDAVKSGNYYSFTEPDIPVPDGFLFDYWHAEYKEDDDDSLWGTSLKDFNNFYASSGKHYIYYIYPVYTEIKDTYTVKFYLQSDFTTKYYDEIEVAHGDSITFPDIPTWDGYIFLYWDIDYNYKVTKDIKVYGRCCKEDKELNQYFSKYNGFSYSSFKNVYIPLKNNVIYIDNVGYLKLEELDDASIPEGYTLAGYIYNDFEKALIYVRRHIVGGANRTLISVKSSPRLCRIGTCRRLSAV